MVAWVRSLMPKIKSRRSRGAANLPSPLGTVGNQLSAWTIGAKMSDMADIPALAGQRGTSGPQMV